MALGRMGQQLHRLCHPTQACDSEISIAPEGKGAETLMRQETNEPSPGRLTGNRARVRRYRANHRRIDYVPSPDV